MQDGVQSINSIVEQKVAELNTPPPQGQEPPVVPPKGQEPEPTAPPEPQAVIADPAQLNKLLEETGFGSVDELKEFLAKKKEPEDTPEQIQKKEELRKVNLAKFAVENNLMKSDDIHRLETVKNTADEDLVFNEFAAEVKDEILERLDDDAEEEDILAEIRKEFESEYPIHSKNEKQRARAEAKLKKAAAEIRSPLESSFNNASQRYDDEASVRAAFPKYQQSVSEILESVMPKSYSAISEKDGDEEIQIGVDITEDDRKAILDTVRKKIDTPETFILHRNGKTDEIKTMVSDAVEYAVLKQFAATAHKKVAEAYYSRGLSKGSVGAANSFAAQGSGSSSTAGSSLTAEQQILDSTRNKK